MKQALNIATNQQLQLTPKLQQAIHMLQLSSQELTQEIQTIMEANIMLESDDELGDLSVNESQSESMDKKIKEDEENYIHEYIAEHAPVEIKDNTSYLDTNFSSYAKDKQHPVMERYHHTNESLHAYLLWQLTVSHCSYLDQIIGQAIIDSINVDGYLELDIDEIQTALVRDHYRVSRNEIKYVLKFIQSFEPVGVGARDLRETLLLQLNALPQDKPGLYVAKIIVDKYLTIMADHNYIKLRSSCGISKEQLDKALELIQTLKPRPGNILLKNAQVDNIIPDVIVHRENNTWVVTLNDKIMPKIQISKFYSQVLNKSASEKEAQFINSHLQEARWLIKCLKNRNETLIKVAACIVKYQTAFMEHGMGAMKPLVLRNVADDLGLHPSTISRITTNKYIQTPQGTYELKYFFTSHLSTNYGYQCSSMAIRSYIQNIIKSENSVKPLSDDAIAKNLLNQGIKVARRTVSKYRESLAIPPANKRKKLMVT